LKIALKFATKEINFKNMKIMGIKAPLNIETHNEAMGVLK
jgi:hypothetical protein